MYDRSVALRAIGNSGNDGLLDVVAPYFRSTDVDVRTASYLALRRMKDPRAQETLISEVDVETSATVREVALRSLSEMPATASSMAWARNLILNTSNIDQQTILAHYLGQALSDYRRNGAALREVLRSNPPVAVRQAIYNYITPS